MASPYREAALVEREERRKTLRYVNASNTGGCPICHKAAPLVSYCNPFRRLTVQGFLWWAKECPLPGVHWHKWCDCGAHIIGDYRAVEVEEEPL